MIKNLFFKLLKAVHSRQRKYKGSDIESAWYVYVPENVIVRRQRNNYHSNGNKLLLAHRCGLYFFFSFAKREMGISEQMDNLKPGARHIWNNVSIRKAVKLPKITVRRIQERGKAQSDQRWDTLIINKIIIE